MPSLNLLAAHRKLERVPLGRGVVSRAYRTAAPYFLTIPAHLDALEPGRAVASMGAVPWTRNHLGGVHAIAQCNLAEYVMGAVAEATVPAGHRWIPRGMTVDYRSRAAGRLTATATLDLPAELADKQELPVRIAIVDGEGTEVTSVEIRIWVTAKRG